MTSQLHTTSTVAVVGGGISGLTCAFRLKRAGFNVTLFDANEKPGGVIKSERVDDFLLELGPNSVLLKPELAGLIDDLDLANELSRTPMRDHPRFIFKKGYGLLEAPASVGSFLKTPLISFAAKLRLCIEPFLFKVPDHEITVADFARHHMGREMFEMFIAPFISGVYAGDPEVMSLQGALHRMDALVKRGHGSLTRGAISKMRAEKRARKAAGDTSKRQPSSLCSFPQGLERLPEAIAQALGESYLPSTRVTKIERDLQWHLTAERSGETIELSADALVVATTATAAKSLMADAVPVASEALSGIPYLPITVTHIGVNNASLPAPPRGFGFLAPRNHGLRILGTLWTSGMFDGRAPEGHSLLTIFMGGATDKAAIDLSDEELFNIVANELKIAQGWNGEYAFRRITRYCEALPEYRMGHVDRIARLERAASDSPCPLRFAGNYLHGISVADCIGQANRVAEEIAQTLKTERT